MRIFIFTFIFCLSVLAEPYEFSKVPTPDGIEFSLGGMCLDHSGNLLVSTRSGEIWRLKGDKWFKLASGLQEPMALVQSWREGEYFSLQRAEVTKMVDEDHNGTFDLFESFGRGWEFTGSKNDFAMAMTSDQEGNLYAGISLSLTDDGFANVQVQNRGLFYKIDYVGEKSIYATGAYKPVGATFNKDGDLFISENQGGYIPANCIFHVEEGDFLGNPLSLAADPSKQKVLSSLMRKRGSERIEGFEKLRKRPALYLPDNFSGSGIAFDTADGKFGPFKEQLFIADFDNGVLSRAYLEKVKEVYQGAVFTFMEEDALNALRLQFTEEGSLYIGKGGDGCCAGSGLYKINWNKKAAFDVKVIQLTKNGFKFVFTTPVQKEDLSQTLKVKSFYYDYTSKINAKKLDEKDHSISEIKVSENSLEVEFSINGLQQNRIYQFDYSGLKGADGNTIRFSRAYYTLNELLD